MATTYFVIAAELLIWQQKFTPFASLLPNWTSASGSPLYNLSALTGWNVLKYARRFQQYFLSRWTIIFLELHWRFVICSHPCRNIIHTSYNWFENLGRVHIYSSWKFLFLRFQSSWKSSCLPLQVLGMSDFRYGYQMRTCAFTVLSNALRWIEYTSLRKWCRAFGRTVWSHQWV